jgi:hypothetical protein
LQAGLVGWSVGQKTASAPEIENSIRSGSFSKTLLFDQERLPQDEKGLRTFIAEHIIHCISAAKSQNIVFEEGEENKSVRKIAFTEDFVEQKKEVVRVWIDACLKALKQTIGDEKCSVARLEDALDLVKNLITR